MGVPLERRGSHVAMTRRCVCGCSRRQNGNLGVSSAFDDEGRRASRWSTGVRSRKKLVGQEPYSSHALATQPKNSREVGRGL